jgi:hypothetical protein
MVETTQPRTQGDLAEMVEMLLDKGVVINADVVVSIGDTELLGVKIRAAIASFETAAEYGLEFPEGTDTERVEAAAGTNRRTGAADAADEAVEGTDPDAEDESDDTTAEGEAVAEAER